MEAKPYPFLVASLMNRGGDQTHLDLTLATALFSALAIIEPISAAVAPIPLDGLASNGIVSYLTGNPGAAAGAEQPCADGLVDPGPCPLSNDIII